MKKSNVGLLVLVLMLPVNSAFGVDFSIGGGWPFLVVPEISGSPLGSDSRLFGNIKIGQDNGFSAGFEHSIGKSKRHALGFVVGSIGVQNDDRNCRCFRLLKDRETTEGYGFTYSYNFSGLNEKGMRLRLEAGQGEGSESKEKRNDGSVILSYQF